MTALDNYVAPASLEQAVEQLQELGEVTILAGGTDLMPQSNAGRVKFKRTLMNIRRIPELRGISREGDEIRIGALTTITEIMAHPLVREHLPLLVATGDHFASAQIRNAGTVGGNLVNASPIADSLPFFYAAEARVELDSTRGRRTLAIAELYRGYKELDLLPDELLAAVVVPLPGPGESLRLLKVSRRRDLDISTFTAALWLRRAGGRIEAARLALGGVGPTVVRLPAAEARLAGAPFALASFRAAGELAAAEIRPISDVRGSAAYRRLLARNALVHFFHDLGGASDPAGAAGSAGGAA